MLTKLGKYEIRRELGRGAMGIVYEGFDPYIERIVALKTVQKSIIDSTEAEEAFSRFRREAQAAGRLTHPNIVSVYEYGEDNDIAFIAMEFVTGKELKSFFDKGERFPIKDSVQIMSQLLCALDYSHGHSVVHRDIKPANIVINEDGQVKVVDFGIARIESSELTQVGTVLGTPTYMSPEQFMGIAVDGRSDIYSAGVILYQFLTGERPFTGNITTIMHKVLYQAPVAPRTLNPELPKALEDVVNKAIAKKPEERFQTAGEFIKALNTATGSAAVAPDKADSDATLVAGKAGQGAQADAATQASAAGFDLTALMSDIGKQLNPASQDVAAEANRSAQPSTAASASFEIQLDLPEQQTADQTHSSLLAGLAREAEETMGLKKASQNLQPGAQPMQAERLARNQQVQQALGSLYKFFAVFAQHVNKVEPAISRSYRFGRQKAYANLTCRNAFADSRKQDLSETALLDYAVFDVRLCSPKPVVITWPWDQLEDLKEQLKKMKLRALDNLEPGGKRPLQEWMEVNLAPDLLVQLKFKGNYDEGRLDVQTLNLEALGAAAFKLELRDVTQGLMDDLGLFLLGRTEKLPEALRRV